jgi:hypothetical protein
LLASQFLLKQLSHAVRRAPTELLALLVLSIAEKGLSFLRAQGLQLREK